MDGEDVMPRLAILNISVEFLVEFCKGGQPAAVEVVEHALPADAKIIALEGNPDTGCVQIRLESADFQDVSNVCDCSSFVRVLALPLVESVICRHCGGTRPPELPSPMFRRVPTTGS